MLSGMACRKKEQRNSWKHCNESCVGLQSTVVGSFSRRAWFARMRIDPGKPGSNLHKQDKLLDEYATDQGFLEQWSAICEQDIAPEEVDDEEVVDLRPYVGVDPGKHD